jgi:hypothetical protein
MTFDQKNRRQAMPAGRPRSTILLSNEATAVEVKHTRASLLDGQVGKELIDDIAHYRQHANCKALFCLVYDPGRLLINPQGLQTDLTGPRDGLEVVVVVVH